MYFIILFEIMSDAVVAQWQCVTVNAMFVGSISTPIELFNSFIFSSGNKIMNGVEFIQHAMSRTLFSGKWGTT